MVVTRARISVRSAPADGVAGLPVELRVESRSRVRVRPVEPPGPEVFVGPGGRRGAVDDVVTLVPVRRGVHDAVTLDIASAAPFALQWWTRRVQLPLPVGAARVAPLRHARSRRPGGPTRGRATSSSGPGPTAACPAAPAPTCPATPAAWSTGARRPTPAA